MLLYQQDLIYNVLFEIVNDKFKKYTLHSNRTKNERDYCIYFWIIYNADDL